jgi:hypothetical protein
MTEDECYRLRVEESLKKYATPEERLAFQDGIEFQIREFRKVGERLTSIEDIEHESEMYQK